MTPHPSPPAGAPGPITYKALSIHPKWAGLIRDGIKTLEVRSRRTHYRGPLLICSSLKPKHPGVPEGHALCLVDLIDCRPMTESDAPAACVPLHPNHFVYVLSNPRPLPHPFPVKGQLGLFEVRTNTTTNH